MPGLEPQRAELLPAGSMLLAVAIDVFGFDQLTTSDWALREGIVLDAVLNAQPIEEAFDVAAWNVDAQQPRDARGTHAHFAARRQHREHIIQRSGTAWQSVRRRSCLRWADKQHSTLPKKPKTWVFGNNTMFG